MTATVDEMRRLFGPFGGDTDNLPPFDGTYRILHQVGSLEFTAKRDWLPDKLGRGAPQGQALEP